MTELELTVDEMIRRAGGPLRVSKYLAEQGVELSASAVSKWKDRIPADYWEHLAAMTAEHRPITFEDLAALRRNIVERGPV